MPDDLSDSRQSLANLLWHRLAGKRLRHRP